MDISGLSPHSLAFPGSRYEAQGRGRGRARGRGRGRGRGNFRNSEKKQQSKKRYDEEVSEELLEPLKVYVGCLRHEVTEGDLRDVLLQYAKIKKVTIIKDKFSRGSKGYGFVTVESKEDVDKLLGLKDGDLYICGKSMVIKRARKQILQPGHSGYKRVDLSDRPYDLMPPDPDLPSAHILVDDVLVKIISYLPVDQRIRIERVCRRWQALVHLSFATMTSLEIEQGMMGLSRPLEWPIVSKLLVLTGPSLRVLKISDMDHVVRNNLLRSIGQLCPNLNEIEMNLVRGITSSSLEELSRYCPGLQRFIAKNSPDFTEKSLHSLLTRFRNLECLDISLCVHPVGDAFKHLPDTIKELHLLGTRIKQKNLEYIPQNCPNLEVLDVGHYDCSASFFEKLNQNCPKLFNLYVEVSENLIPSITGLKGLKSLTALANGILIDKLTNELPQLESLNIEMVAVQPTTDLSNLKNLKKLSISNLKDPVHKETLMSITKCTQLEEVVFENMSTFSVIPKCFLIELVKQCPLLKRVDINILEVDLEDLKKLNELVKDRITKLVIISKQIKNEVLEADYNAEKLELACRYSVSEHSGSYDSYDSYDMVLGYECDDFMLEYEDYDYLFDDFLMRDNEDCVYWLGDW